MLYTYGLTLLSLLLTMLSLKLKSSYTFSLLKPSALDLIWNVTASYEYLVVNPQYRFFTARSVLIECVRKIT
jgi:hypothetical protein